MNYVASNSLYLTARFAHVNGPFSLTPKGGLEKQVFVDADGVYHNTNSFLDTNRPQKTVIVDGSWFRGRHELKFGGSFRRVNDETFTGYGNGWLDLEQDSDSGTTIAIPFRNYIQNTRGDYSALYAGDTIAFNRLTVNAALRLDRTTDSVLGANVPAHPDLPDVLPGVDAPAVKNAVVWNAWTPRIGATFALDSKHKTQLRGSYAAFASQLNVTTANAVSAAGYAYAYYLAVDGNHNQNIETSELVRQLAIVGVNPENPLEVVNAIAPNLSAPRTHEIVAGIDHELMPNFGLSASYTWRRYNNVIWPLTQLPVRDVTSADYLLDGTIDATLPDGTHVSAPYYALTAEAAPVGGGNITENRDGYHRTFKGLEVSATKRLSNRWMARFGYSWNNEREYFDNPATAIVDPTSTTNRSADQWWSGHSPDGRKRQVADLSHGAEVPVHRERVLRGTVGRQLRRELPAPARVQPGVLCQRRGDQRRRPLQQGRRRHHRSGQVPSADPEVAGLPRGEGLHVRPYARGLRFRRVQPAQLGDDPRTPGPTCRHPTSMRSPRS